MTERDIIAALSPVQTVALTLWAEGRSATADFDHDGIPDLLEAIASVILNRVKVQWHGWGLTAQEVCLQPKQFSCWNPGADANHLALLDAARHLLRSDVIGPILRQCLALAAEVCTGTLRDAVNGATFYYSPAAMTPAGRVPSWAVGHEPVAVVSGTRFYRLNP